MPLANLPTCYSRCVLPQIQFLSDTLCAWSLDVLVPTEIWRTSLQACTIMKKRHFSSEQCQDLVTEMQAYKSSRPPFNAPLGNVAAFQPKLWWQGIDPKLTIVHLAVFLYDIVPHAATVERLFSLMGWFHNARRNRLGVDSTGCMTAIKTFYEQKPPRCASYMRHTDACNECKVT